MEADEYDYEYERCLAGYEDEPLGDAWAPPATAQSFEGSAARRDAVLLDALRVSAPLGRPEYEPREFYGDAVEFYEPPRNHAALAAVSVVLVAGLFAVYVLLSAFLPRGWLGRLSTAALLRLSGREPSKSAKAIAKAQAKAEARAEAKAEAKAKAKAKRGVGAAEEEAESAEAERGCVREGRTLSSLRLLCTARFWLWLCGCGEAVRRSICGAFGYYLFVVGPPPVHWTWFYCACWWVTCWMTVRYLFLLVLLLHALLRRFWDSRADQDWLSLSPWEEELRLFETLQWARQMVKFGWAKQLVRTAYGSLAAVHYRRLLRVNGYPLFAGILYIYVRVAVATIRYFAEAKNRGETPKDTIESLFSSIESLRQLTTLENDAGQRMSLYESRAFELLVEELYNDTLGKVFSASYIFLQFYRFPLLWRILYHSVRGLWRQRRMHWRQAPAPPAVLSELPGGGNPFKILGILRDATCAEAGSAARSELFKYHPDKLRGKGEHEKNFAAVKFAQIKAAQALLADKDARQQYEDRLQHHASAARLTAAALEATEAYEKGTVRWARLSPLLRVIACCAGLLHCLLAVAAAVATAKLVGYIFYDWLPIQPIDGDWLSWLDWLLGMFTLMWSLPMWWHVSRPYFNMFGLYSWVCGVQHDLTPATSLLWSACTRAMPYGVSGALRATMHTLGWMAGLQAPNHPFIVSIISLTCFLYVVKLIRAYGAYALRVVTVEFWCIALPWADYRLARLEGAALGIVLPVARAPECITEPGVKSDVKRRTIAAKFRRTMGQPMESQPVADPARSTWWPWSTPARPGPAADAPPSMDYGAVAEPWMGTIVTVNRAAGSARFHAATCAPEKPMRPKVERVRSDDGCWKLTLRWAANKSLIVPVTHWLLYLLRPRSTDPVLVLKTTSVGCTYTLDASADRDCFETGRPFSFFVVAGNEQGRSIPSEPAEVKIAGAAPVPQPHVPMSEGQRLACALRDEAHAACRASPRVASRIQCARDAVAANIPELSDAQRLLFVLDAALREVQHLEAEQRAAAAKAASPVAESVRAARVQADAVAAAKKAQAAIDAALAEKDARARAAAKAKALADARAAAVAAQAQAKRQAQAAADAEAAKRAAEAAKRAECDARLAAEAAVRQSRRDAAAKQAAAAAAAAQAAAAAAQPSLPVWLLNAGCNKPAAPSAAQALAEALHRAEADAAATRAQPAAAHPPSQPRGQAPPPSPTQHAPRPYKPPTQQYPQPIPLPPHPPLSQPTPRSDPLPAPQPQSFNQAADDRNLCAICLDRPKSVLMMPCKHVLICGDAGCMASCSGKCPLCRTVVESTIGGIFI